MMEYLGRGKRGVTYTQERGGRVVVIKERRADAAVDTIKHEAVMLERLNPFGIGPRFIAFEDGRLVREFVDGEEFLTYCHHSSSSEVVRVLSEVFFECRKLDLLGVNKFELTRPYKHILVGRDGRVVQIDFERCRVVERPKNVTQFVQCVVRDRVRSLLAEKNITIDVDKMQAEAKEYKKSFSKEHFDNILRSFGARPRAPETLAEKVYEECMNIPRGEVRTYKEVAQAIGTKSYRAVGQALRKNPYAPRVPCHRVVASDKTIGGFRGATKGAEVERKKQLLRAEGVEIQEQKIVG